MEVRETQAFLLGSLTSESAFSEVLVISNMVHEDEVKVSVLQLVVISLKVIILTHLFALLLRFSTKILMSSSPTRITRQPTSIPCSKYLAFKVN
jgi:hypothetical protein